MQDSNKKDTKQKKSFWRVHPVMWVFLALVFVYRIGTSGTNEPGIGYALGTCVGFLVLYYISKVIVIIIKSIYSFIEKVEKHDEKQKEKK